MFAKRNRCRHRESLRLESGLRPRPVLPVHRQRAVWRARCVSPITNCGICVGGPMCQVCGSDGVTYESVQVACVAGVRVIQGACGDRRGPRGISCGRTDQCQQGDECCALTGKRFSTSEPWRCPADSSAPILDCTQNSDCSSGAGGGNPGPASWCAGQTCGQPGTCRPRVPSSTCSGTVQTVCGCDGLTYVNECWANAAGRE